MPSGAIGGALRRSKGDGRVESLLDGVRVIDLAGEPAAITGRVLADLGADVVLVEPPGGSPLRLQPNRFRAWAAGKTSVEITGPDDPALDALLAAADVVVDTPGFPGALEIDPARAPHTVWVSVTPFGAGGPRATWRASDLGVLAASGNMYATGNPDRPPVRCTEPSGYAHSGGEAAFAVLTALWTGAPQRVDLSMQEVVDIANMCQPARYDRSGHRGTRHGANIGRTREIWPAKDGWVSFGLRGGKARIPSLQIITKAVVDDGIDASALLAQDWNTWDINQEPNDVLRAVEAAVGAFFARHTMQELYDLACETNLMLAPANSPREILASKQLDARGFFAAPRRRQAVPRLVRAGALGRRQRRPRHAALPCARARHRCAVLEARRRARGSGEPDWKPGTAGVVGRQHHRVRLRRGRADRDALLRRARRHGVARRVAHAPRLPAHDGDRARQPAGRRRLRDVRRPQRRQAQRHAQPQAPRLGRAREAARRRVGRRRRRELRAARCADSASTTTRSPRSSPIS